MKKIVKQFYIFSLVFLLGLTMGPITSFAQTDEIPGDVVGAPSVSVSWSQTSLENTEEDKSGYWYYKIKSSGDVTRDIDQAIYLNLEKTDKSNNTQVITLAPYAAGGGLSFPVSFPPCSDYKECDKVKTSPVEAGYTYQLYFSDVKDARGNIISDTNKITVLDTPAYQFSGDVISGLNHQLKDDGVRQWYSISGTVSQDVSGSVLDIFIRDNNGEEFLLGRVEANSGTNFTLPQISSQNLVDLNTELNHTVLVRLEGKTVQTYLIEGTAAKSDDGGSNDGSGSIIYNETQQDIIGNGIVAKNCGYNLSEGGRICGFGDVIALIQRIIEYIFVLILPIAAIVIAYVGFLYLTSGGDSGKKTKAKAAMLSLLKGIILVMAAWLIVKTILVTLGAAPEIKQFLGIVGD